jgi:hypothetical protein
MDFGDWIDAIFGGGGGGPPSVQGGPRLDQGFSPVIGWAIGQGFAGAGPVGQYVGLLYGLPREGIPNGDWERQQQALGRRGVTSGGVPYADYGDYIDLTVGDYATTGTVVYGVVSPEADPAPSQPAESRTLDALDRGESGSGPPQEPIAEVNVFGQRPDRPPRPSREFQLEYDRLRHAPLVDYATEIPRPESYDPIGPPRPRRTRSPTVRKPSPADPLGPAPQQPQPERDPVDSGPYFDSAVTPSTVPGIDRVNNPWMSDVPVPEQFLRPEQFLKGGAWERPESVPSPRPERGDTGRIETIPTAPLERSFWSRGGTGLAAGAASLAGGVAVVLWWNPVGWVAGATALAIAGGVAATTASAVQLGASYGGATSQEQDAAMNRAVSATLGYSSIGGVLGGVAGTVGADDAQVGFEEGIFWGGLVERLITLPGALRAVPGLWRAALPWAKSLLVSPVWFSQAVVGGGGNVRSLARVFAAQGRIASRVRSVEYLGTTPLLERDADWARFQVFVTRTRNEGVFRITYANGQQRIVLADRFMPGSRTILEAKYGNMGMMFDPTREAHIMRQANNNLDISNVIGGRTGYLVSDELGAVRLTQRFAREFPAEMASGQLWIDLRPWQR